MGKRKYLLDTNIFNHVLDGKVGLEQFVGGELFSTHIQLDEINGTLNLDRRNELLSVFQAIGPKNIPTSAAVWGISKWGQSKWSSDDKLYQSLLVRIRELDKSAKRKKLPENQSRDALIAVTALREKITLVTNDLSLATAAQEEGCNVINEIEDK